MTTRRFYSNYDPIISNPVRSYEDEQRQHHRDIGELPDDQIGYQIVTLTNELAERSVRRRLNRDATRSRVWMQGYGPDPMTDLEWLADRTERLKGELVRRRRIAA